MYYFLDENKVIIGIGVEPHSIYESISFESLPSDIENPMGYTYINGVFEKSNELLEMEKVLAIKEKELEREKRLSSLVVSVGDKTFISDEVTQNRILRALQVLGKTESIKMNLADGSVASVSYSELKQVLKLMVLKTSEILTGDVDGK
jgi:hypothetical protein|uniref:Uncharacterized protein n=1 Tax=Podoviridae sp. ctiuS14 TaxID=2827620 RepID=A0A8S5LMM3_9CAUD|nr:MAG TPA: hypothetical protein [Podoviridae sp. ctiuS14]